MKITIPEEYRDKFESEKSWIKPKGGGGCIVQDHTFVFITRWTGHGLLITNKKIKDELEKRMGDLIKTKEKGVLFLRLLTAGMELVEMSGDGTVELPEWLTGWLGEGELNYQKDNWGIVVSAKEQEWHK